jgi:hypothetical protein
LGGVYSYGVLRCVRAAFQRKLGWTYFSGVGYSANLNNMRVIQHQYNKAAVKQDKLRWSQEIAFGAT